MLVMSFSWAFSTLFFQAFLRTLGPPGGFGQFSWPSCDCMERERGHVDKTVYTLSESTLSSAGGNHRNSTAEMHELDPLTAAERPECYRNHPNRSGARSRYQHQLSVASTSSGGSESSRSRGTSDVPGLTWAGGGGGGDAPLGGTRWGADRDTPSPLYARRSSATQGTSHKLTERPSSTGTRYKRTGGTQQEDVVSDNDDDDNDADQICVFDRTRKKNTFVSLTNSSHGNGSESQASVQLVQPDPTRPGAEITTDSNSNRTDVHTDKHSAMGGAEVGGGCGGLDQTISTRRPSMTSSGHKYEIIAEL